MSWRGFTPCQQHLEDSAPVECQNCDWIGALDKVKPVQDPGERLFPGETIPAGECPECGSCAYLKGKEPEPEEVGGQHEGWSNRETWAVYHHFEFTCKAFKTAIMLSSESKIGLTRAAFVEERMRACVDEICCKVLEPGTSMGGYQAADTGLVIMVKDIGSLWRVEFGELADAWISEENSTDYANREPL